MGDPFVLVVNPRAGAGAAQRRLPALRRALASRGARFDVRLTSGPRDATRIVRATLREGAHAGVAVVGGDETLNEAVNGFFDDDGRPIAPERWIAPLPCGTGGDFRRTLGTPNDVEGMVGAVLSARPRPVDVGWLSFEDHDGNEDTRAFLNIASFGLAGLVDRQVNDGPKWIGGRAAFTLGTLRAMVGYRNQRVLLRVDGGPPKALRALNVAVANGRYFGGGMHIAPGAAIDDGRFDIVALEMNAAQALASTLAVYRGTHLARHGVWHARGKEVTAEAAVAGERVWLDVDGETPGRLPATFALRAGALRLRG